MGKKERLRQLKRKEAQRRRLAFIGVLLGFGLLVGAVLIGQGRSVSENNVSRTPVSAVVVERPMVNFNGMGDPNAPVRVEEFSDFQCPYCSYFTENYETYFVENYVRTGKVYFIYRSMGNFLSDNINRATGKQNFESILSAEAAYCAGDQGKFWEYHDTLFANQTGEGVGDFERGNLILMAQNLGLDMDSFTQCLDSARYKAQAEKDEEDGLGYGVTGTPSFVVFHTVNGQEVHELIVGADPQALQNAIEKALADTGQ